jgi:hypothetical protein
VEQRPELPPSFCDRKWTFGCQRAISLCTSRLIIDFLFRSLGGCDFARFFNSETVVHNKCRRSLGRRFDRFVLIGIVLGAQFAEPRMFGITALTVISLLLIAWSVIRSVRLSWLLVLGLVPGLLELWADWVHVVYFHSVWCMPLHQLSHARRLLSLKNSQKN